MASKATNRLAGLPGESQTEYLARLHRDPTVTAEEYYKILAELDSGKSCNLTKLNSSN